MKACYHLYKKEINSLMFLQSVILLLIFGWFFFLYYKAPVWPAPVIFGLGFLPLTFLPLLMLWQGYHSFKKEWENDTIYYLLSLPRRGWQLILPKLFAGLTVYFIATVISLVLIYSINQAWILQMMERLPGGITPDWVRGVVFKLGIGYILSGLVIYVFS
ncbi:MAG: ABC transporter permease subunit, partial [Bacillota bacterium]